MFTTRNIAALLTVFLLGLVGSGARAAPKPPKPHPSGTITVIKSLVPATDPGRFDLKIGTTTYTNDGAGYGDRGNTGGQTVDTTNNIAVSESAHGGTAADDYSSSYVCTKNGAPYSSGVGMGVNVAVGKGNDVVCTFTNTRGVGTIELKKAWSGGISSTTLAIGSIPGSGDVASKTVTADDTTGPRTVATGTYFVSEPDIPDYTSALTCAKAPAGGTSVPVGALNSVAVGAGDEVVCTFTNTLKPVRPIRNDCSAGSVQFTFDDGPSDNTAQLIQTLKDLNLKATFFVVGENIDSPAMEQLIREEAAAGFTIGSHTYDHASFTGASPGTAPLTAEQATAELENASAAIVRAGGPKPTLYRPPYGDINNFYDLLARNLGYRVVLSYGTASNSSAGDGNIIDSQDWSGISPEQIAANVTQGYTKVQNGTTYVWHGISADTIVAMHDGTGPEAQSTIASLQAIVDYMNAHHLCSTATIRPDATGNIVSPPPPAAPATGNLVQNPDLELVRAPASSTVEPVCFQQAGYGIKDRTWTLTSDAHSGVVAERIGVTSWTSGDDKLVLTQRPSEQSCLAAATPGASYSLWVWYKGDWSFMGTAATAVSITTFYRNDSGAWVYWQGSPWFPPTSTWNLAYFKTGPLPVGATAISYGLAMKGVGSLTTDDYTMVVNSG